MNKKTVSLAEAIKRAENRARRLCEKGIWQRAKAPKESDSENPDVREGKVEV